MAKVAHKVKLVGYTHGGQNIARLGKEVRSFRSTSPYITVLPETGGNIKVITKKGEYILTPSLINNRWEGSAESTRLQFSKKKLVAQLTYWA